MAAADRIRVGLALGGGGSRGFAHIGILKILEAESIPIDIIAGTSIGAIMGGAYASGISPQALEKKVNEIAESPLAKLPVFKAIGEPANKKELGLAGKIGLFFKSQWLFTQALFNTGMLDEEDFQSVVNHFIPDIRIEETKIPFRAVAADLITGREVVLSRGPLRQAVMASCAVPGFMPPVKIEEMMLVDGGTINLMPCSIARQWGANIVIGIDVDRDIHAGCDLDNAIDVYTRAAEIGSFHLSNNCLKQADIVIRPGVGDLMWFDLSRTAEVIGEGERCARESMKQIKKVIGVKKKQSVLTRLLGFLNKKGSS